MPKTFLRVEPPTDGQTHSRNRPHSYVCCDWKKPVSDIITEIEEDEEQREAEGEVGGVGGSRWRGSSRSMHEVVLVLTVTNGDQVWRRD
ncbi:hypothetical protein HK102_004980, partial [Quaeritorhiza haematococci]